MLKLNLQFFAEEVPQDPNKSANEPPTEPAAEPKTPDSEPSNETPQDSTQEPNDTKSIPYDRFKQVNDEAKQFKETFKELGLEDTESLKALVADYQAKKAADEERKRAEMTEVERLQAEKAEADEKLSGYEQRLQETIDRANKRLIKSEFNVLAKELGVRKDALDDAYQAILNDDSVKVDEEGNVTGVKEAGERLRETKAYYFDSNDYRDPSPSNNEPKREEAKKSAEKELAELADKVRKYGRIKDRIAYTQKKKELGL